MKDHEDNSSSAVDPIEAQEAMFDAAQAAIRDAKDVLISPRTRSAVAALRSRWFDESPPPGVFAEGSTDDLPAQIDRLAHLGRNVMIGMVQRCLDELGVPTSDSDALALVRAAVEITSASDGAIAMPPSPLHLVLASRMPLGLPSDPVPPPAAVESLSTAQLREILRALAPADLARHERAVALA
jgi:hypothetical protein